MNLATWQARIVRYARSTFASADLDDFTALANAMIARDLRAFELTAITTINFTNGAGVFPSTALDIIALVWGAGRQAVNLDRATLQQVTGVEARSSGTPGAYVLTGGQVSVYPASSGAATAQVFNQAPIVGTANDPTSDTYPELYLAAGLKYAYRFNRDYAAETEATDSYQGWIDTINAEGQEKLAAGGIIRRV